MLDYRYTMVLRMCELSGVRIDVGKKVAEATGSWKPLTFCFHWGCEGFFATRTHTDIDRYIYIYIYMLTARLAECESCPPKVSGTDNLGGSNRVQSLGVRLRA